MSLYIEFEPHSFYKGFAIKKNTVSELHPLKWTAVTDDGNTYQIVSKSGRTLKELKQKITEYRSK